MQKNLNGTYQWETWDDAHNRLKTNFTSKAPDYISGTLHHDRGPAIMLEIPHHQVLSQQNPPSQSSPITLFSHPSPTFWLQQRGRDWDVKHIWRRQASIQCWMLGGLLPVLGRGWKSSSSRPAPPAIHDADREWAACRLYASCPGSFMSCHGADRPSANIIATNDGVCIVLERHWLLWHWWLACPHQSNSRSRENWVPCLQHPRGN